MLRFIRNHRSAIELSLVVVVYRMSAQAKRTLHSLSTRYQREVSDRDYEVLVIENASDDMLGERPVREFGQNFRYFLRENPHPSPATAINFGVGQARGEVVGIMVDGARMLTPGVIKHVLLAARVSPKAVISIPGYHLGERLQQQNVEVGYDEKLETQLLSKIGWPEDGYRLFEISCMSGSNRPGFFRDVSESNCLWMRRCLWDAIGGCEERFDCPGGGYINLDLYKRACEHEGAELILLPGEGSFHQLHGGITTGGFKGDRKQLMLDIQDQYRSIRGASHSAPRKKALLFGKIPDSALRFFEQSIHVARRMSNSNRSAHMGANRPDLSMIVIGYRMARQLENTLYSLSSRYQRNISANRYEVIVVENESDDNLDEATVRSMGENFRYFRRQETAHTPVHAINFAFEKCRAPTIGLMIDGARMLTPRVLEYALMAQRNTPNAFTVVPGYHLGEQQQHLHSFEKYNEKVEAQLLERIDWKQDGYRLFSISTLTATNQRGFFHPMMESNCIFASAENFRKIGYADTRFDLRGGGAINLHIFRSLGMIPGTKFFMLPGEGSFHQIHGGITTSVEERSEQEVREFEAQLHSFWDGDFSGLRREPILLGAIPYQAQEFLKFSAEHGIRRFRRLQEKSPFADDDTLARLRVEKSQQ